MSDDLIRTRVVAWPETSLLERLQDARKLLRIHGMLSEAESRKAYERIIKAAGLERAAGEDES